jgi:hypothetical protein
MSIESQLVTLYKPNERGTKLEDLRIKNVIRFQNVTPRNFINIFFFYGFVF